jgi:hypothetical protein
VVEQAIFDVTFDNHRLAYEYEHCLVELCSENLLPIVDEKLTTVKIQQHRVLDYLEIDLGVLDVDNLQNEMIFKLSYELERIINDINNVSKNHLSLNKEQQLFLITEQNKALCERDKYELISWLLNTGSFSCIKLSEKFTSIQDLLATVVKSDPQIIVRVILATSNQTQKIQRLINLLTTQQLLYVIQRLCENLKASVSQSILYISNQLMASTFKERSQKYGVKQLYAVLIHYALKTESLKLSSYTFQRDILSQSGINYPFDKIRDDRLRRFLLNTPFVGKTSKNHDDHNYWLKIFSKAVKAKNNQKIEFYGNLLLTKNPAVLLNFINCYQNKSKLIKVITASLSNKQLLSVISHQHLAHQNFIYSLSFFIAQPFNETTFTGRQRNKGSLFDNPTKNSWRTLFWNITLSYVFVDRETFHNQKNYLLHLLTRMASAESISYEELLIFYQSSLLSINTSSTLKNIINELLADETKRKNTPEQILINKIIYLDKQQNKKISEQLLSDIFFSQRIDSNRFLIKLRELSDTNPYAMFSFFKEIKKQLLNNHHLNEQLTTEVTIWLIDYALSVLKHWSKTVRKDFIRSLAQDKNTSDKSYFYLEILERIVLNKDINIKQTYSETCLHNNFESILVTLFTKTNACIQTQVYLKIINDDFQLVLYVINKHINDSKKREIFIENLSDDALIKTCSALYNEKHDDFLVFIFKSKMIAKFFRTPHEFLQARNILWSNLLVYFNKDSHRFNYKECLSYLVKGLSISRIALYNYQPKSKKLTSDFQRSIFFAFSQYAKKEQETSADDTLKRLKNKRETLTQFKFQLLAQKITNEQIDKVIKFSHQYPTGALELYDFLALNNNYKKLGQHINSTLLYKLIENYLSIITLDDDVISSSMNRLVHLGIKDSDGKKLLLNAFKQLVIERYIDFSTLEEGLFEQEIKTQKNISETDQTLSTKVRAEFTAIPFLCNLIQAIESKNIDAILNEASLITSDIVKRHQLINLLSDKSICYHLSNVLPESKLLTFISYFSVPNLSQAIEISKLLAMALSKQTIRFSADFIYQHQWTALFNYYLEQGLNFKLSWFIENYFSLLEQHTNKTPNLDLLLRDLSFNRAGFVENSLEETMTQVTHVLSKDLVMASVNEDDAKNITSSPKNTSEGTQEKAIKEPFTAYINNAGLVLLAPYLPQLFEMLKLTQHGQFIDLISKEIAANALQQIVMPYNEYQEPALALNKLLCGLELNHCIATDFHLTKQQIVIVNDLITGVITHWKALGNTTVDGFRDSFLKRTGALYKEEGGWKLEVLPQSFDMLIDQLPWSFSPIKFSWMKQMVRVSWRNT